MDSIESSKVGGPERWGGSDVVSTGSTYQRVVGADGETFEVLVTGIEQHGSAYSVEFKTA